MSSESESDLQLEIGHVLFMDSVGYSKLIINEQSELLQKLNDIARNTPQVRAAETAGKLIRLPTGDGMALVFRNSPEAPAQCALEISKVLKSHPEIQLRMGIHSGPINEVVDVNERTNVTGAGINMAQRVMDCGDAGHILLSKRAADDLAQYRHWRPHLHELGECDVKHGSVQIVNLYTEDSGNPQPPLKFASKSGRHLSAEASSRRKTFAVAVLLFLLAALGIFVWRFSQHDGERRTAASLPDKSIAVLPFENLSEEKANAYFASGIRDEILTKLAQVEDLKVVARTSADKFNSRPEDIRAVGRQLNVATILEGSVQKAGEEVLINVQLIDVSTNSHRWAQSYKRSFKNIFDLEGEVAQRVADALKIRLAPDEARRIQNAATRSTHAHDLFLRARALNARSDEQSFRQAITLLQQAVAEDPHYAAAWAELTNVYLTIADAYCAPVEVLSAMRNAAAMAVQSDEKYAPGHVWRAGVAMLYDRNFELAKRESERAVALDPNSSEAHRWLGWYQARVERNFAAGRAELQRAHTLDPLNPWPLSFETAVAIAQGDNDAALQLAEQTIEIDPQFFYDVDPIARAYTGAGRWQDAIKRYESLPAGVLARPNFELAICYAHIGETERAREILAALETLAGKIYIDKVHLAAIYATLGDHDKAFAALDRAAKDRSARVSTPRFYNWLAPLFDDPRFAAFEYKVAHSSISSSDKTP